MPLQGLDHSLSTKIHVQSLSDSSVSRPALIERLNSGIGRMLTIISAPVGSGKSSHAAGWIAEMSAAEQFGQATIELLGSPLPPPAEQILTPLLNQISSFGLKVVLLIEDF